MSPMAVPTPGLFVNSSICGRRQESAYAGCSKRKYLPLRCCILMTSRQKSMCFMAFSKSFSKSRLHASSFKYKLRAWSLENFVHGGLQMTSLAVVLSICQDSSLDCRVRYIITCPQVKRVACNQPMLATCLHHSLRREHFRDVDSPEYRRYNAFLNLQCLGHVLILSFITAVADCGLGSGTLGFFATAPGPDDDESRVCAGTLSSACRCSIDVVLECLSLGSAWLCPEPLL